MSEQDPELGDIRSEADEVLTSGADSVAEAEPSAAVEQAEETLAEGALADGASGGSDEESSETLDIPLADLRPALEAVLMVADQPLDHMTLASAVGYPPGEVASALHGLAEEYAEQGRGFDLRNVAGGWRYYTREEYASVVERFVLDGQQARLPQAALETLAVEEAGHDGETTAMLYRTTSYFLERIGVESLEDLPELAPFLPDMGDFEDLDARPEPADVAADPA